MNYTIMTREERWLLEEKYEGKVSPAFEADRQRLSEGEPLAYVIGWQPFLGLKIFLDSHPLIPRPETEWWTEEFIKVISKTQDKKPEQSFLDLCAGSGAIGCAVLAQCPKTKVYFGEIDPSLETTILKNIRENDLDESRADIRIGDLFRPFEGLEFDFIAANPPYVPMGRKLPGTVSLHEPSGALFAKEDGLEVIQRIIKELPLHLKRDGVAWIECDSAHASAVRELSAASGMNISIRTDQYGVPRFLVVSFP